MNTRITGKIIVVGDNIDTDQIYPGRFLAITDPKEIGSHCLSGVSEDIAPNFPQGGIVVAGRNFGCGSSREHAPIALLNMGASAASVRTLPPTSRRAASLWRAAISAAAPAGSTRRSPF